MSSKQIIDEFERLVYAHKHGEACLKLSEILRLLETGKFKFGENGRVNPEGTSVLALYTVLAAAIRALLADTSWGMAPQTQNTLALQAGVIDQVFQLSGFRDGALWYLLDRSQGKGAVDISLHNFEKGLLAASPRAIGDDVLAGAIKLPVTNLAAFALGKLSTPLVLSAEADRLRNDLILLAPLIARAELHDLMVERVVVPWMYCTYAEHAQKHQIKAAINAGLRRWIDSKGIRVPPPRAHKSSGRDKPLMVVVMERGASQHAMMRCYRGSIESLRKRFRTVGFIDRRHVDDDGQTAFDKAILVDPSPQAFQDLVNQISQLKPDAIYFPSLGMSPFAVWLANLRLAPIQFMSPGHPATSMSPEIDYAIVAGGMNFDPGLFSERVVELASAGANFDPFSDDVTVPEPDIREAPAVIRIAVAARLFKLTCSLLDTIQEIGKRSPRPIELHFFPNEAGTLYLAARREITRRLPGATVHPSSTYGDYLKNLGKCDIALGPLVFGNTNSAVDASLLAIPMVAMDGPEFHTGTEEQVMRLVGLPRWLVASSREEYIQAALRLIENDAERVALSRSLVGKVQHEIYGAEHERNDFADTVSWLYDHHEDIQRSNLKCIRPEHRRSA